MYRKIRESFNLSYYDISSPDARLESRRPGPGDWALPVRAWVLPAIMRDKKDIIG